MIILRTVFHVRMCGKSELKHDVIKFCFLWWYYLVRPVRVVISIIIIIIIIIIIYPLTARVVGAPQMIWQPVISIFPCSPLPSGTCRTPGLSIPWCCLPTSSFVCLVFFPLSLCLARWFWPDLINGKHDNTAAVCVSLRSSRGLRVWSNCLLDLGTDFFIGNMGYVTPTNK